MQSLLRSNYIKTADTSVRRLPAFSSETAVFVNGRNPVSLMGTDEREVKWRQCPIPSHLWNQREAEDREEGGSIDLVAIQEMRENWRKFHRNSSDKQ